MADKAPGPGELMPTQTEYKKSQLRVRELVEKRRQLERRLVSQEWIQNHVYKPGAQNRFANTDALELS